MELRHLRYFVAVAEEGSLTLAAERRLHTAQPSLSRQIRDLETELGVELITRSSRGIELTAAGKVFLDHARLATAQVEAAAAAARRAAQPEETTLALGFLSGCEPEWLPAAKAVLRTGAPSVAITIASKHSPQLADALAAGKLDAAFMRPEWGTLTSSTRSSPGNHWLLSCPAIIVSRRTRRSTPKISLVRRSSAWRTRRRCYVR